MKSKIFLFFIIILSLFYLKVSFAYNNNLNLYQSKEYGFKIEFPEGWNIEDAKFGSHIVKKALNDKESIILISVRDVYRESFGKENSKSVKREDLDYEKFSTEDIETILEESTEKIKDIYRNWGFNVKIIEQEVEYIANRKSIYIKYSIENEETNITKITYTILTNGYQYGITGQFLSSNFSTEEKIIKKSILTFVFKDWQEKESSLIQKQEKNSSSFSGINNSIFPFNVTTLILGILLTWGGGLLIPVLIRYVFIRRPINKLPAIAIVIFLYFIQFIVWAALGSTRHTALIFVAFVSYYILNKGYKKEASKEKENQIDIDKKI